ncbi:cyclase [Achromatium sp. WMS2]|nr:cyclase [Achromatium sp. WMS2]
MNTVHKTALVRHSATEMFLLVKNVHLYPEFLPWCQSTKVLSETDNRICAELVVARLGIHQAFSTCNNFEPGQWMEITLQDGPFSSLHGMWTFLPLREDACKVTLKLDFEFSSILIERAFGSIFNYAANSLVDAFCKRADAVYGSNSRKI